jgi:hypothetical protein
MSVVKAAGEIDSWCTKCKLVLNHRVIAMVSAVPVKVECSTCRSHHNFRARAPGDKGPAKEPKVASARSASSGVKRQTVADAALAAVALERSRLLSWEKSIAGKAPGDFRAYRISEFFNEGDLIMHKKFGEGIILSVIDAGKVQVLFRDEPRTLAHGMP